MDELRGEVRRLRIALFALGGVVLGLVLLGAGGSVHRELTVRKLTLVDDQGRSRVVLFSKADEMAGVAFLDPSGQNRIQIATAEGQNGDYAGIQVRDVDGVHRIDLKVRGTEAFAGLGDQHGIAVSHWKHPGAER
jgi:hypothetical protein